MKTLVALIAVLVSFFSVGNLLVGEDRVPDQPVFENSFLTLQDTYDDGSKENGRVWCIQGNGEYSVYYFDRLGSTTLIKEGKFSQQQLDDLKDYLLYRGLDSMPESLMRGVTFGNATHTISLRWKKDGNSYKTVLLHLPHGQSLESVEIECAKSGSPDAVDVDRFASIVKTIKALCSE